eukprot:12415185-Karenia_brevis.AAC.1
MEEEDQEVIEWAVEEVLVTSIRSKAVDQQWRDETWEVVEADLPRQRLWCPQLLALSEPPK